MIGIFIVSWRESIEAALLVGILMVYLKKVGHQRQYLFIYIGVLLGILSSLLFGLLSTKMGYLFEGQGDEIFSAAILLLAVAVLTYMVVWMSDQAKDFKGKLQQQVDSVLEQKKLWALTFVAFSGVFREGIETVLFLWGIFFQDQAADSLYLSLASGLAGIILAVLMAWFFFRGFGHLDMRRFFQISGLLLLLMSGGMLVSFIGKLETAGVIPPLSRRIWDSSRLIDERTLFGHLFSGFFGYRAKPSLMEVLVYLAYFVLILGLVSRRQISRNKR